MPIYEYECSECGVFEAIQKPSDKPLKAQPDCPHKNCPKNARRLISQSAFHLKGGGWYKTDYASSGSAAKTSKKSTETKTTETKTESTSSDSGSAKSDPVDTKKSIKAKGGGGSGSGGCGSGCGCH